MRLDREEFNKVHNDVMSNFDGIIDREIESRLKSENVHAGYSAWNFHGNVWYQDERFHCEIWRYQCYTETISAETLEEIMSEANEKHGFQ